MCGGNDGFVYLGELVLSWETRFLILSVVSSCNFDVNQSQSYKPSFFKVLGQCNAMSVLLGSVQPQVLSS